MLTRIRNWYNPPNVRRWHRSMTGRLLFWLLTAYVAPQWRQSDRTP